MGFKNEYSLIQQTPLIHFQPNQHGATLRATEVKPKLDRFMFKFFSDRISDGWKIGEEKTALNYKLHIQTLGPQKTADVGMHTDYDIFYGNTGVKNEEDKKRAVIGNAKLTVICMIPKLMQLIDDCIGDFFIATNFGTMQNKGFGSYAVEGKEKTQAHIEEWLKKTSGAPCCYYFNGGSNPFKKIKKVYSVMKSGCNLNGTYQRSYLFLYFHDKEIGNEKCAMKKEHVSPYQVYDGKSEPEPVRHPKNDKAFWNWSNHEPKYVRAVLGTSEKIEYISRIIRENKKGQWGYFSVGRETITIKNSNIERCASPVRFKVIDGMVYMYADRVNKDIFNKKFTFKNKVTGASTTLDTPDDTFDVDDFLAWFVKNYNNDAKKKNLNGRPVEFSIGTEIQGGN